MALSLKTVASVDEQYKKFSQLNKEEVLKLKDWYEKQPHLPNITGELDKKSTFAGTGMEMNVRNFRASKFDFRYIEIRSSKNFRPNF